MTDAASCTKVRCARNMDKSLNIIGNSVKYTERVYPGSAALYER